MKHIQRILENCQLALRSSPVREFVMQSVEDLKDIPKAIYIIQEVGGDSEKTFESFVDYKKGTYVALPAINKPNSVLYVGSSTTNLKNRILQHLTSKNLDTYALHLSEWFQGQVSVTIKEYDVSREVLQLLEDQLAEELQPAFGKRGTNNR